MAQFEYFNCVPLVSCWQEVKEVVANGSLSKAFVSTLSRPVDGGNPLLVRMRMKPFVSADTDTSRPGEEETNVL